MGWQEGEGACYYICVDRKWWLRQVLSSAKEEAQIFFYTFIYEMLIELIQS